MPELLELIREMRAGLEGTTPGPWVAVEFDGVHDLCSEAEPGSIGTFMGDAADVEHIARCSPENIAKLLDAAEAALQQMTWPDACSLTVKDGVVQAAYNTDEEAEEVFRLLAPTPPHIGSSGQTGDGRP